MKQVIVIGAGLGGIAAAIALRQRGYAVSIYEKNPHIGGKLNTHTAHGFTFDLGPSILTLPHVFEQLFAASGKKMADYVTIRPLRPHWRNFFPDGHVVDLDPDPDRMAAEARKVGENPENVRRFLEYSARLYDLIDDGYFQQGLDTRQEFARHYGLCKFPQFDLLRSMHGGVRRYLKTRHLRDIFDYFIKYVGSSAYRAPAFMNCLPTIQFRHDLWYVDGGLYRMAAGLQRLMDEIGVAVHCHSEITQIVRAGQQVTGVMADQQFCPADIVVCNMEVTPAYQQLLDEDQVFLKSLARWEPSCSGLVIDLGLNVQYPHLAHHNFFYSANQKQHFDDVFRRRCLPQDPTVYVVAASRSDASVAPSGCENLKVLPHIPHIDDDCPLQPADYQAFKDRVLEKLEGMGLTDLRQHIVCEHVLTPLDIRALYNSNRGSIYGVVSDRFRNLSFKAPKQSTRYANLFFVGGSVNPGGGMPMVVMCGQQVARKVVAWDRN